MNVKSLKVGDRVGVKNQYKHVFGNVIKITATGQVTVCNADNAEATWRFDNTGREFGARLYSSLTLYICDAVELENEVAARQARIERDKVYHALVAVVAEAQPRSYNNVNTTPEWCAKVEAAVVAVKALIK